MNLNPKRPSVLNVVAACTVRSLLGELRYLHDRGFDVAVVSPGGKYLDKVAQIEGARAIRVPMARNIAPISDLIALLRLCSIMYRLRPTVTNVGTPKAGLLGGFAAW